ncbi:MAG: type II toxin-antitoxin system HicA family toxin [Candidatus Geothermarchaeales archaeon]
MGWREVLKVLHKKGFRVVHQRGSHIYLTDVERRYKVSIPRHASIKPGTLLSIIRQAGLTREEFLKLLG